MYAAALLGTAFALMGTPALAATKKLNMVHDATPQMTVQIEFTKGSLKVVPSKDRRVYVRGVVEGDIERVFFIKTGNTLQVRFLPDNHKFEADIELALPPQMNLKAETVSAPITAHGTLLRTEINTVSGDIRATGRAAELAVNTVSGEVYLKAQCPRTEVNTVSGDMELWDINQEAEVNTVSGESSLTTTALSRLEVSSVSGDIKVRADFVGAGPYDISTQSADVELELPAKVRLDLNATTFSGEVDNKFPKSQGGTQVSVTTFSGDIKVTPQ